LGDFLTLGEAIAGVILTLLTVVGLNYRAASGLETATYNLVRQKESTVLDPELLAYIRSLPVVLPTLNEEQRERLSRITRIYSRLELLTQEVLTIQDNVTWSFVLALPAAALSVFTGFLYEQSNSLYALTAIVGVFFVFFYFAMGIYPTRRIRKIQRANQGLQFDFSHFPS
jgi:hypothetical protein